MLALIYDFVLYSKIKLKLIQNCKVKNSEFM